MLSIISINLERSLWFVTYERCICIYVQSQVDKGMVATLIFFFSNQFIDTFRHFKYFVGHWTLKKPDFKMVIIWCVFLFLERIYTPSVYEYIMTWCKNGYIVGT